MSSQKITLPAGTIVPNHIAVVLDGNRRWARSRGLEATEGHRAGFEAMKKVIKASRDLGVHTITVWGFSTENWDRSKSEIAKIMHLIRKAVKDVLAEAKDEEIRFVHLGRKDRIPKFLSRAFIDAERKTAHNQKYIVNFAIDYGGRDEMIRAMQKMVASGVKPEDITVELFDSYLDTAGQPYPNPDLFIRTSGEQRTSGMLQWQMAYTEYYWELGHLPDMTPEKLRDIIIDYSRRRRRFGGNDKEAHFTFKPQVTAKLEVSWWRLSKIPKGMNLPQYAADHIKEQWGVSTKLAAEAALLMVEGFRDGEHKKWRLATQKMKKFYDLIRDEVKLAFEPALAAKLQVNLWQKATDVDVLNMTELDRASRQLVSEVYRISDFQATKAAHLMSLATVERAKAHGTKGEVHWKKAQDYLEKYYAALKDRVA